MKLNILLGQRLLPNGKIRMHWQVDEDYYPVKPYSSVNIDDTLQLIPVEEKWLSGDRGRFEGFTIPYYDYIYMKDMSIVNEAYIVQPFLNDVIVVDLEVDDKLLQNAFTVESPDDEDAVVMVNKDVHESIVLEFTVVGGLHKSTGNSYTEEEVKSVDMAIGFKGIWREDLGKLAEAFYYATLVNQNSIDKAVERGDGKQWGGN